MVSLFIFPTGPTALDSEPRGRNTPKIWDTIGTVFIQGPSILLLADGPWIKAVPVVSRIFDVSSSTGLWIEGCRTCWKDELGNHTLGMKAQNMHQLREFLGLNNKPSTSCRWFLCFGTRPRHHTRAPWLGPLLMLLSAPICIPQAHGSCSFSLRVFPQGLSISGSTKNYLRLSI